MLAFPTILEKGYNFWYSVFKATSGCMSPSNSKSTFCFFSISTASLICSVLLVIGCPNVECDTKATLGSNPNNLTTLAADLAILDNWSDVGHSWTLVSATNIVFPSWTTRFIPNIISPSLAPTTCFTFSNEAPNLLVLPVTAPSASPHATIQDAHVTRSFLTNLSQSHSSRPCSLWSFLNKNFVYFSLFKLSVEFVISKSKWSSYPIFSICSLILDSLPTRIGIPNFEFLNAIAAFKVFSSSPSANTILFCLFFIELFIPFIIVTDGSNLCFNCSL